MDPALARGPRHLSWGRHPFVHHRVPHRAPTGPTASSRVVLSGGSAAAASAASRWPSPARRQPCPRRRRWPSAHTIGQRGRSAHLTAYHLAPAPGAGRVVDRHAAERPLAPTGARRWSSAGPTGDEARAAAVRARHLAPRPTPREPLPRPWGRYSDDPARHRARVGCPGAPGAVVAHKASPRCGDRPVSWRSPIAGWGCAVAAVDAAAPSARNPTSRRPAPAPRRCLGYPGAVTSPRRRAWSWRRRG